MTSSPSKLAYNRKYRVLHRDRYKAHVRQWRKNNPERTKEIDESARLNKRYGITIEDYDRMFDLQGGCCEICGKPRTDYKRSLHVDHDHSNGNLRGLLCVKCNSGIGYFNDDITLLEKAKAYLVKYGKL